MIDYKCPEGGDRMNINLQVVVNHERSYEPAIGLNISVPNMYVHSFDPICICDEPYIAMATGDDIAGSYAAEGKMRLRKDAAKVLSEAIAELILKEMKKKDTYNGYPVIGNNDE